MEILILAWNTLPALFILIAASLVLLNVHLWRTSHKEIQAATAKGKVIGYEAGYHRGHVEGAREAAESSYDSGYAAGHEAGFLETGSFLKCPHCDHAVHVPVHLIIEGEPGAETIKAEPDTTEFWVHIGGHDA